MRKSAGLLMYRRGAAGSLEVLLAHPGGPYWRGKDDGAWTLPKGEYQAPEQALDAARREFAEETGYPSQPPFLPLGEVTLKSGKRIAAWAFEGDGDPAQLRSNAFELEWPPRSGRFQSFAELDRVQWFGLAEARRRINATQAALIDRFEALLESESLGGS